MKQVLKRYIDFSLRSWGSEMTLRLSTVIILIFTFSVTIFLAQSAFNFKRVMNRWGDNTKITVYLAEGQNEDTRQKIENYLKRIQDVESIKFISQDEAIAQFSKSNSLFTNDFIDDLKEQEVFPESFEVTLNGSIQDTVYLNRIKQVSDKINDQIGVEEVSYGQGWIEKYSAFLRLMNSLVAIIVTLFIAASLLIISNLIRVMVHNQRDEIEILELIGETKSNIRMPFIIEGVVFSVIAYTIGLLMNMVLFNWIANEFAQSTILSHLAGIVAHPELGFISTGLFLSITVGLLSSYFTARSVNTGWALATRSNK
ncbi:MAG: FtsX-like permease family protein [Bdellovibrionaceae bacterium]|nr:FtsX-like permease family protein [Pseudobdellovibrionaceae bacterium]